ncbi:YciI family protein [Humibacter ginsengisoli]
MSQYAVLIYGPADPVGETTDERDAHDSYADDLTASGDMVVAVALQPAETTAVSVRHGEVTDGPFVESKELIAGFYVIEADDLGSALEIARRNPINRQGGGVEVRPVEGAFIADRAFSGD